MSVVARCKNNQNLILFGLNVDTDRATTVVELFFYLCTLCLQEQSRQKYLFLLIITIHNSGADSHFALTFFRQGLGCGSISYGLFRTAQDSPKTIVVIIRNIPNQHGLTIKVGPTKLTM